MYRVNGIPKAQGYLYTYFIFLGSCICM